jgi:hypothetical protein
MCAPPLSRRSFEQFNRASYLKTTDRQDIVSKDCYRQSPVMIEDREQRALVAAPMPAQKTLRRLFAGCNADFFDDYDLAAVSLRRRNYAVAIVGLQFAESRMLDFVREVRSTRPELRVVCVIATRSELREASRRSCQTVLRTIGVEGLVDFTTENLSLKDHEVIETIVAQCRRRYSLP